MLKKPLNMKIKKKTRRFLLVEKRPVEGDIKMWKKRNAFHLKTAVSRMAPKHWIILAVIRVSTFSSRCRLGSCLPTFLMANCSGLIFSSSSRAWKTMKIHYILDMLHEQLKSFNLSTTLVKIKSP